MALTVPVEAIQQRARQIDAVKVLKVLVVVVRFVGTVLVGILYWTAWLLGKVWLALTMLGTAAVVGWRDARGRGRS